MAFDEEWVLWPGVQVEARLWDWPWVRLTCRWPEGSPPASAQQYTEITGNGMGAAEAWENLARIASEVRHGGR